MRASDHDRDRTVRLLRQHNVSGRISTDELEHRLERALSAETADQLAAVVNDLPPPPPDTPPIVNGSAARIGLPGIRPFLVELVARGEREQLRALTLRTIGAGLIGSGFELVHQSSSALEFVRVDRPLGPRGWFAKDYQRVVISFAPHGGDETAILVFGRANRRVRKDFARFAQG